MDKQRILNNLHIKAFYTSELPSLKVNDKDRAQALSPFHNDQKASLSINLQTGFFKCFGCDIKGSVFDFYMKKHSVLHEAEAELLDVINYCTFHILRLRRFRTEK